MVFVVKVDIIDTDVLSGNYVYWCVVLVTLVGASLFSFMWLELLMMFGD